MKIGIIFGSASTESDISVVSASHIIKNLDYNKYDVIPIYLDKKNDWFIVKEDMKKKNYKVGTIPKKIKPIKNIIELLKKLDVVFPVLHGKYGEDGTIQGLLELIGIPYVGCGILASSVCLDKFYTKALLGVSLSVTDDIGIKYENNEFVCYKNCVPIGALSMNEVIKLVEEYVRYPAFVKPSRFGSSVGIKKVDESKDLISAINLAKKYDNEILIEKMIKGRELECAIFKGNAMAVGEVITNDSFYSYDAKYKNPESKTIIPADIPEDICESIKEMASKAFKIVNGKGLARVDFFLEEDTNKLYINEINTMPGFTDISMYPRLVNESGISYENLLDELIMDAKNNR